MWLKVALVLFLPVILLDAFTCYLTLRKFKFGKGPSGVPFITVFVVVGAALLSSAALKVKLLVIVGYCLLHYLLIYGIPALYRKTHLRAKNR